MRRLRLHFVAALAVLGFGGAGCPESQFWEDDFTTHDGHRVYPEAARECHEQVADLPESRARREFRSCLEERGYRYAPSQRFWQR